MSNNPYTESHPEGRPHNDDEGYEAAVEPFIKKVFEDVDLGDACPACTLEDLAFTIMVHAVSGMFERGDAARKTNYISSFAGAVVAESERETYYEKKKH